MSRSGDASTRVAVVTDESGVRDAAVDALASADSLSAAVPSSEGAAAVREAVESGADCLVCGTGAGGYDAVRELDRAIPVVVLDPASGIDAGTLNRVLDDPAAAYVAGDDHLGRVVRSRVREFVGRGRLGWQLADRADDAVVSFDLATYAVREANDTFFKHWALSPADLYTVDVAEGATADNERIMETGEPLRDREKHVQPPHGRDLWFSTNKAPWYDDDGRLQGIVGVTVDITDRKRRERELDRQNERLEEFAGILSHDLRNPLNVAQGRLDRYRGTGDESELDTVAEMHDRIGAIIDDVLDYAREGSRVEETEWFEAPPSPPAPGGASTPARRRSNRTGPTPSRPTPTGWPACSRTASVTPSSTARRALGRKLPRTPWNTVPRAPLRRLRGTPWNTAAPT
jgi:signal transduction histidine kinase